MDKSYAGMHGRLPSRLLHPLKHLQTLTLSQSGIRSAPSNAFHGLRRLQVKGKGKEEYLYSAFAPRYTQSAEAWITQFYLQTTPCLPFLRGVHQMSPPQQLRQQASNCSSPLIYRPRKDERLSWRTSPRFGWETSRTQKVRNE